MIKDLEGLKKRAEKAKARMDWAKTILKESEEKKTEAEKNLSDVESAKRLVAEAVQEALSSATFKVNELGTLALKSVMDEETSLAVELTHRRGRTEADVFIERDGNRVRPLEGSAGGEIDLAALAIQVSFWALGKRTRPVMILDEPLKWLKGGDLPSKGAEFMEKLSKEVGLQFIIVSHVTEQVEHANVIEIQKDPYSGISSVKTGEKRIRRKEINYDD